jgi:DNA-binding transcriptional ArsR family regulator
MFVQPKGSVSFAAPRNLSAGLTISVGAPILKLMLNQVADLDRVFQALADPGRRLMLERLSQGPASVSELGKPLAISLAAVVQHVQVLEASGLVRSQKTGRTRTCSLNPPALRSAETWIAERRSLWERRLDRLGDYLADAAAIGPSSDHIHDNPGYQPGQPEENQ